MYLAIGGIILYTPSIVGWIMYETLPFCFGTFLILAWEKIPGSPHLHILVCSLAPRLSLPSCSGLYPGFPQFSAWGGAWVWGYCFGGMWERCYLTSRPHMHTCIHMFLHFLLWFWCRIGSLLALLCSILWLVCNGSILHPGFHLIRRFLITGAGSWFFWLDVYLCIYQSLRMLNWRRGERAERGRVKRRVRKNEGRKMREGGREEEEKRDRRMRDRFWQRCSICNSSL